MHALLSIARRIRYLHRRPVSLMIYGSIAIFAYSLAFLLRFEFRWPVEYNSTFAWTLPVLVAVRLSLSRLFRLSTSRWRYVGTYDLLRLLLSTTFGSLVFFLLAQAPFFPVSVPNSVLVLEAVINANLTAAVWVGYRTLFEQMRHRQGTVRQSERRRVLLVGAGEAGNLLAREMARAATGYRPLGFVDDDSHKWGTSLNGVEVIGSTNDLPSIAPAVNADEIIIAIPTATPAELRRIVDLCEQTKVPYRVLPGIRDVLAGKIRLYHLREVQIEDLLGREPIKLDLPALAADLHDKCVLITGAAGSIGSELAGQVALHSPSTLVLFDQSETELFYLQCALREQYTNIRIVAIVGDVVDARTVERVFTRYAPERVFHAAAYKHVPMMELNVRESIRNNTLGTCNVGDAAGRYGAEKFVLVSTDKAVRPSSVMGATKRLAELVVLELQEGYPNTSFSAVRFGNVLGSNGSVIPIFKRQIEAGRPLTVTHPDATRYFMTIPEAVQLILQASLLPELRGHIAMLEMGHPVRIVDLAKNLLRLSGAHYDLRERLIFTGLRPGERLHEELVAPDEETVETAISKVRIVKTRRSVTQSILGQLKDWEVAFEEGREASVAADLSELFPQLRIIDECCRLEAQQPETVRQVATK